MTEIFHPPPSKAKRGNTGDAEQAMREVVISFFRKRLGGDVRVLHEIALGDRRTDLLFVAPADLVAVEIKGPRDSLSNDRLSKQMREYRFYIPEVWVAIDHKWRDHKSLKYHSNLIVIEGGEIVDHWKHKPARDEMCCSRLLELLWNVEAARIAQRTDVLPGPIPSRPDGPRTKKMLARLLTGNEILKEVCAELRSRHAVGIGSDDMMSRPQQISRVRDLFGREK